MKSLTYNRKMTNKKHYSEELQSNRRYILKGRKAIPSKIVELRGGTKHTHKKPRSQEPQPPEKMPRCPKHLNKEARKEWRRCGKLMQSIGLMSELDMAVFAGYCDAYSQWAEATDKVHTAGMVYQRPDKTLGLNPYLRIARDAYDRMLKAAVLLGLSQSSRVGLKVERPKQADPGDEFLRACRGNSLDR